MTFPLSDEQSAIVTATPGPLRIDAGAGTGKTYTLVRLVEALVAAGTPAPSILGITFTNKAAGELAGRIREAVAGVVEPGLEVDVHTYHGFAARLLREYGPYVGVERDARVITPTFARQLLLEALATTPDLVVTDLTSPRHRLGDLIRLAAAVADNLVDPAALVTEDAHEEVGIARTELARVIARFVDEKRRLGVLDYGDLIAGAHRLVTEHPEVAKRIRERHRVVLLDEYQDTDPAQRRLLQALFADGRTVVAVGDADQTIYEWRGASLQNFTRFPTHFPTADGRPAPTLPLTRNRRSGQHILDVANRVRAVVDPEPRTPLTPVPGTDPGRVTVGWYRTGLDEATAIAEWVAEHHAAGTSYGEMAVLVRANRDMALIRGVLADAGVPTEVASLGGLLDVPEVVDVHAWLRVLDDPGDSVALARLALGSRARLGLADLRPLTEWVRAGDETGVRRSLTEALDHLDEFPLRPEAVEALAGLGATLRRLLRAAQGLSLVELVREILAETDAWRDVEALPAAASLSARLNLYRFLDLAEQWSPLEGRPSLEAFLAHLELLREDPTEELDAARLSGEDAVALLTVHRAKGLEWDVVFLPTLAHGKFPTPGRNYPDPHARPWALPHELRLDGDTLADLDPDDAEARKAVFREAHERAEWRLGYVAVTRARRALHTSGAAWYGVPEPTVRPRSASALFETIAAAPGSEVVADEPAGERPELLVAPAEAAAPDPLFADGWDAEMRATIADPGRPRRLAADLGIEAAYDAAVAEYQGMLFALPEPPDPDPADDPITVSVSAAVTYARCPRQYFWSHVDPLPRRHNPAAARGIAVHRRIELHNLGHLPLDDAGEAVYDVVDVDGPRADGAPAWEVFAASRFATDHPLAVEAPFELPIGEAVVRGRIDAVYGTDDHWEVVDFKSGRPSDDPAVDLQLDAYAVAAAAGALGPAPERLSVTFAHLGGGLVERTTEVTPDRLEAARARLVAVIDGIDAEAWAPTPGDHCRGCDFLAVCEAGRAAKG